MIQELPIKYLILDEKNPRKITKQDLEKLCESLVKDPQYMFKRPVLVNKKDDCYYVYAGNQRVRAAKKLKWKNVPCIVDDDLDPAIQKDRIIKDNQHYGTWDYDLLADIYDVEELIAAGFSATELDLAEIEDIVNPKIEEDKDEKCKMCPSCGAEL